MLTACAGDDASPPDAAAAASGLCGAAPVVTEPLPAVQSAALTELSGLVASRRSPEVWWAHNDSGGDGRLHVLGPNGEDGGSVGIEGAANVDWEDLAIGPGSDGDLLYVADIGNNLGERDTVSVEVVAEPRADEALPASVPILRSIQLTWPDGARNAEALLVDPRTSELVVITQSFGAPAEVYVADGGAIGPTGLTLVGTVDLRGAAATPSADAPINTVLGLGASTAADITAAGDVALVRTYGTVLVWPREEGQSVAEAIVENEPCEAMSAAEAQGEALAVDPDGGGYRTTSEGRHPPINRFAVSD